MTFWDESLFYNAIILGSKTISNQKNGHFQQNFM